LALRRTWGRWLALLGLFVVVAVTVELAWWRGLDHHVNDWAATQRETLPWYASQIVFDVATPEIALPVTLALGLLVAWKRRRREIAGEAAIRVGLAVAAVLLLKPLLGVPGPHSAGKYGGAFPSGHTTSTVVCVALLLAWVGRPRWVTGRVAVATGVVAVVGVSVVYIHYHYVSDVVGGVVLGLLIAALPLPAFRRHGEAAVTPSSSLLDTAGDRVAGEDR
jgi:membrane-associated phospholipid phosphatase